ncbi:hypothetical protein NEFER03_0551 [Nematocida sp. LUAm3]|nr:hypothetical protein NEFER03_0551 [Nematocida sp. LUAm3]KAI5175518.1 hypothetical protein NEFER02_1424 [Nematocida sp. LUAm2]KAI5178452.1 hypothetical protein NEFER01_1599 [Nematocida sp. LUAm1]
MSSEESERESEMDSDGEMRIMQRESEREALYGAIAEERRKKEEDVERGEMYANGVLWGHRELLGYFFGYIRATCLLDGYEDPLEVLESLIYCIRDGMRKGIDEEEMGEILVERMKRVMDGNVWDPCEIKNMLNLLE